MKCPNCNETLLMTDRQGVEIDYCPSCRGVWLDKGELDKLIEKATSYNDAQSAPPPPPPQQQPYYGDRYKEQYRQDPYYKHKKKKGFLDDFFDF
jgi:Zn-finger nucleic acid-binding protein